jgi:hypothetical protein
MNYNEVGFWYNTEPVLTGCDKIFGRHSVNFIIINRFTVNADVLLQNAMLGR